jgi:hypothetical protein
VKEGAAILLLAASSPGNEKSQEIFPALELKNNKKNAGLYLLLLDTPKKIVYC